MKKNWPYFVLLLSYVPIVIFIGEMYVKSNVCIWVAFILAFPTCVFYLINSFLTKSVFKESEENLSRSLRIFFAFARTVSFFLCHFIAMVMAFLIKLEIGASNRYFVVFFWLIVTMAVISAFRVVTNYIDEKNFVDVI